MELLTLLQPKNIIGFIIILTRLSGMMTTAPLFSKYPIPPQVKAWIVALIAFVMYPVIAASPNFVAPTTMPELTFFLAKEFAVGALIGFVANFIFVSVQMAGQVLAQQTSLAMSNMLDPATQSQTPVIGEFYLMLATIIFLYINAHQLLFAAVYHSFQKIPPGFNMAFSPALVDQILHLSSDIFMIALKLIIPVFCVFFVLEVLLGVLSKMIPQMNIFMVAIPVKVYAGLTLMLMFMVPVSDYISTLVENQINLVLKMFM